MKIEILNLWTDTTIFAHEEEENTIQKTVYKALESRANLSGADLTPIRDDIWAILSSSPYEVKGLIDAIKSGGVDGSTYQGSCSCLVGTLANVAGVSHMSIDGLLPNPSRPAERFFMSISKGDTPETNQFSRIALDWIEDWHKRMTFAFSKDI